MNRISHFLIAILIISIFGVNAQSQNPDWENSAIFEKNQVKPHARLIPFSTKLEAIKNDISNNSNYQSLNGEWKFKWVETPEQVPENFWQPKFNSENWDNIIVPSNWQMEGFGYPKFRNIALTFKSNPPFIPDDFNPTGCYLREFNLSRNWDDNEIFLRFEGIKSASYVWVNGKEVGYNQGGFEPAEYNITPFLKKGGNTIAVKVLRYSDGSYLENQDMWRLSGIYRDVYIYATPKVHIQDYYVVTNLDQNYNNANLELEFEIQNKNNQVISNYSIEVDVLDIKNNSVWNSTEKINNISISENSSKLIEFKKQIYSPRKWSAEKPNLYKLVFSLNDENGKIIESFSKRIGFREVELIDNVICINGIPVKFNAVNSHMHHPDHGQAIPLETLKKDLVLMKQFNINAVRTSHYPPSPEYLDFADELGVYVFDETDDECHANTYLSENPEWEAMYADRATKMVYRDRNHPSVVIWSAGNEAGSGNNVKTVIETGKKIDPSRPLWMYGGNTFYIPFEDIIGPRYWIPLEVKNIAENKILEIDDQRPSFMDEYIAATGNGLGGLDDYWEIIYKYPRISGGAIWDWIS
ncbi:MAG: glycoside hydrolase family 2, partial [Mariniphaga sp.]|nr:glycoside hydrolase family 2 [Mariniphaga sp.]